MATREERIASRWERIQQRLKADNKGPGGTQESERDETKISVAAKGQIKSSRDLVDSVYAQGWQKVSDIIKDADFRESVRRIEHEKQHGERISALRQEMDNSSSCRENIEQNWAKISQLKVPQDLYQAIMEQKLECNKLLTVKDQIKAAFEQQNKQKSEQYVMLLKKQESDITQLLWRMHKEFKGLKEEYETQLIEIEKAFMEERRTISEKNKKELDNLMVERRDQELNILEIKKSRDAKYHEDLGKVRLEDQEQYNKLKMNLENHIQLLEQQLEEMRAIYQLNTEKLNYNFQVLKEREKENQITVDQQKRREKRLKESLATYKAKYEKSDKLYKDTNKDLSEEYQRITKQYKELQRKFKHFEKVDIQKYNEIWQMNEAEIMETVQKVVQADRVIHEQILGFLWETPDLNFSSILKKQSIGGKDEEKEEGDNGDDQISKFEGGTSAYTKEEIQQVLHLLIVEVPFLIERKVRGKALDSIKPDQRFLYQADSILRALGVQSVEDLNELADLYYKNQKEDFVKLLRHYVSKRNHKSTQHRIDEKSQGRQKDGAPENLSQQRRQNAKEFWNALANVLGNNKLKMYSSLEQWLGNYNKLLDTRRDMLEDIQSLQEQNAQLKELLKNMMN